MTVLLRAILSIKQAIWILCVICFSLESQSQNFVWNKVYGGTDVDYMSDIYHAGSRKYIYSAGNTYGNSISGTSLNLRNMGLSSVYGQFSFVMKADTSGRVIWAKKLFDGRALTVKILSDENDNLYVFAMAYDDSIRVYPATPLIDASNRTRLSFLVKLNPQGEFMWQRVFKGAVANKMGISGDKILLGAGTIGLNKFVIESDTIERSQFCLILLDTNNTYYYARPAVTTNKRTPASGNNFTFWDFAINNDSIRVLVSVSDSVYIDKKLYIYPVSSRSGAFRTNVRLTYALNSGVFASIQTVSPQLKSPVYFAQDCIHYLSKTNYCIGGMFLDTLNLEGFKTVVKPGNSKSTFFYAFYRNNKPYKLLTFDNAVQWQGFNLELSANDGFLYSSANVLGDVDLNGFKTYESQGRNLFVKMDSLGNILWVIRTGDVNGSFHPHGFAFDNSKSVYLGSSFNKKIFFDNKTFYAKDSGFDFLITKIFDYSITRGTISKGPYCAGDTFLIPYTKSGKFDSTNVFIAELSDENGDFDGGHRELGRLKSFKDSTIRAVLPLFDVVSSPAYRIRIISTKPQVQSYYRTDSLRLLIYSKDTANAGKDTTVCYGTSISIKTSGGSKWRWSPGYMVLDSTSRVTSTKPLTKPIRFRIIISDSSGCGKTDTAYKWVYPAPKLEVLNKDTTVCRGSANILFLASGGLPALHPYQYQWISENKNLLFNTAVLNFKDTFPAKWSLLISDACSSPSDTIFIHINRYDTLRLSAIDTSFCKDIPARVKARAKGGHGVYHYTWHNPNGTVNNQSDSLMVNQYGTFYYGLKVGDHCTSPGDSVTVKVNVFKPLRFSLPNDSIICYGASTSINPSILSGQKNGLFRFTRIINNVRDTFVSAALSKSYLYNTFVKATATDMCGRMVSDSLFYSVLPPLKLNGVADTSLCAGQTFRLKVYAIGGKNPMITWKDKTGATIQQLAGIDTNFVASASSFVFIASDDCTVPSVTASMRISLGDPLKVKLTAAPLCYRDTVNLHAGVSGGRPEQYQLKWKEKTKTISTDSALAYRTKNQLQTVYFTVSDRCSQDATDSLELRPMAIARMSVDKTVQCIKDNVFVLDNLTDSARKNISFAGTFFGNDADVTVLGLRRYVLRYRDTGVFELKVLVRSNSDMCVDSVITKVQVKPVPHLDISWIRTTLSYDYSRWLFRAAADQSIKKYTWHIDQFPVQSGKEIEQEFHYTGNVKIRVVAESSLGCSTDTTLDFDLLHRMKFYVPNMVTANNDGVNDGFLIPGQEYMKTYRLQIYNRWGEMLFDTSDPSETWIPGDDGNNVYVFKADILDVYNERHKLNGTFGVVR